MAHPHIYFINELLENMKELVLQIQNCSIFRMQDSNRISMMSLSEVLLSEDRGLNQTHE